MNKKDREPRDRSERKGEGNRRGTEEKGALYRVSLVTLPQGKARGRDPEEG